MIKKYKPTKEYDNLCRNRITVRIGKNKHKKLGISSTQVDDNN